MTDELKEQLIEILDLKESETPIEIEQKLLAKATLQAIKLRLQARQVVDDNEKVKAATAALKTEVDHHNMQLQSLLYEKNHYNKEIATCNSFRSKYTDEDIGLIPEEAFQANAPESLKTGISDSHKLKCQRLVHEKQERLDLLAQLESLRHSKEAINQVVAQKRKQLDDVQQGLSTVKAQTQPIFNLLNLKATSRAESQTLLASINLLPVPLFVLCHQALALKAAFDAEIDIAILGNEKQSELWNLSTGAAVFGQADQTGPAKKRRKSESKAQISTPPILQAHPMSVVMSVDVPLEKPVRMQFLYLPRLEMVTVKAPDGAQQEILGQVYPEDKGVDVPSEAASQILSDENLDFGAERLDRPYLWAQHLCGLDALPSLSPTGQLLDQADRATVARALIHYRKQDRIQTIVQRIRSMAVRHFQTQTAGQSKSAAGNTVLAELPGRPPAFRKIKTWDEIIAEKKLLEQAASDYAADRQAKDATPAALPETEEDNAAPEDGELPDE